MRKLPVLFFCNNVANNNNWVIPIMHFIIMFPSHMSGYTG